MTRYKLDGTDFPTDPIAKRWQRQQIATKGVGEPIYSAFWSIELSFPILETETDVNYFEGKWLAGGLHSATLPHPKTGIMTTFTGTAIQNFEYELMDVDNDSYAANGRLVLSHINLGATGTV